VKDYFSFYRVAKVVAFVAVFAGLIYVTYWAGKVEHPETPDDVRLFTAFVQAVFGVSVLSIGAHQVKEIVAIVKEAVECEVKPKYINKGHKAVDYGFGFKGSYYFAEGSEVTYKKANVWHEEL